MRDQIDFQKDVIDTSRVTPVVVDFWAPWCGPCRILGPTLEKLAQEAADAWRLEKVNTDVQPDIAARYGIRGIPTVKLFIDGEVASEFVGAIPGEQVIKWLQENIPTGKTAE
ncbi:MAG: thioredoxin [Candidatus Neomarinimicrobiota bacterium]